MVRKIRLIVRINTDQASGIIIIIHSGIIRSDPLVNNSYDMPHNIIHITRNNIEETINLRQLTSTESKFPESDILFEVA